MNVAHRPGQADELGRRLTCSIQDLAQLNPADIGSKAAGKAPRRAAHPTANVQHMLSGSDPGHRRKPIGRRDAAHVVHVDGMEILGLGAVWRDASVLEERKHSVDRNGKPRPMSCHSLPLIRDHTLFLSCAGPWPRTSANRLPCL